MPTVPSLSAPSVQPAPRPGVRVGGGIVPPAGPDLSGATNAFAAIVQEERAKADEIAVNAADNQATQLRDHVLYGAPNDPSAGLLNKRGQEAFGGAESALQHWNDGLSAIRGTLKTDRQRLAFQQREIGYDHDLHLEVQAHVAKERRAYDDQEAQKYVDLRMNDALQNYTDPAAVQKNIDLAAHQITDHARRNGLPDVAVQEAVGRMTSSVRLDVLRQYHALGQDQSETAYLAKYRGEFVGKDLLEAEQLAREGSTAGRAVRLSRGLLTATYAPGIVQPGNIDVTHQPRVANQGGSVAALRTLAIDDNGRTVLLPAVDAKGKPLDDAAAIAQYRKTGQQLGVFADHASADAYATRLQQLQQRGVATGDFEPTLTESLGDLGKEFDAGRIDARVYEAAEQQLRRHYLDKAASDREQQQESFRRIGQRVEQSKGDIDGVIRGDQRGWLALSTEQRSALRNAADQIRNPAPKTDWADFNHLQNEYSLGLKSPEWREKFLTEDVTKFKLSYQHQDHFLQLQAAARRAGAAAETHDFRRDETDAFRQAKTAHDYDVKNAGADALSAGLSPADRDRLAKLRKPRPPVHVSQRMLDSAATTPEYKAYLESHYIDVDHLLSAPTPAAADTITVPGGPIKRQPAPPTP